VCVAIPATRGAQSNHTIARPDEPADHALGRSRGGLTTKIHGAADGRCRSLAICVTAGQVHDTTQFAAVLVGIRVPRTGPGRPRTCPDRIVADKAYSSRANRALLRRRSIGHIIPEPADQQAHRARRGRRGGRPCRFDRDGYRQRNVVERDWNKLKQWRGIATRYDKTATNYRGGILLAVLLTWIPR
jgi:transposase